MFETQHYPEDELSPYVRWAYVEGGSYQRGMILNGVIFKNGDIMKQIALVPLISMSTQVFD